MELNQRQSDLQNQKNWFYQMPIEDFDMVMIAFNTITQTIRSIHFKAGELCEEKGIKQFHNYLYRVREFKPVLDDFQCREAINDMTQRNEFKGQQRHQLKSTLVALIEETIYDFCLLN